MTLCYVASAYTAPTEELTLANVEKAIDAGEEIASCGVHVFVPHFYHHWHKRHPHSYEFWMAQCIAVLRRCDCLVRLDGSSKGADKEVHIAYTELHIPVFFGVQDFKDHRMNHAKLSDGWKDWC